MLGDCLAVGQQRAGEVSFLDQALGTHLGRLVDGRRLGGRLRGGGSQGPELTGEHGGLEGLEPAAQAVIVRKGGPQRDQIGAGPGELSAAHGPVHPGFNFGASFGRHQRDAA